MELQFLFPLNSEFCDVYPIISSKRTIFAKLHMNILYTIVIKFKDSNTTASNVALFIIGRHMVSFSLILG